MIIKESDLYDILGKYVDDVEVVEFLRHLPIDPIVEHFSGTYHYSYNPYGISLIFEANDDYLSTIFLYSENMYSDRGPYLGEFPFGLDFQCTRSEVRAKMGIPTHSGGNVYSKEFDSLMLPWDRYDGDDIVTHYEYGGEFENIYLITLMTADEAPEL